MRVLLCYAVSGVWCYCRVPHLNCHTMVPLVVPGLDHAEQSAITPPKNLPRYVWSRRGRPEAMSHWREEVRDKTFCQYVLHEEMWWFWAVAWDQLQSFLRLLEFCSLWGEFPPHLLVLDVYQTKLSEKWDASWKWEENEHDAEIMKHHRSIWKSAKYGSVRSLQQ